jgi:predicted membrane protein (TIGR00267 family)
MRGMRAILRGSIDGCVSVLGVVIGAYGADSAVLLSAALAGTLANGASNMMAAFSAESAQRTAHLQLLERSMLTDLHGTEPQRAVHRAALREALADAMATMIGGLVPVAPFFFLSNSAAMLLSVIGSLLVMMTLGAWTGYTSRQGALRAGCKFLVLGILTAIACFMIHHLIAPDVSLP